MNSTITLIKTIDRPIRKHKKADLSASCLPFFLSLYRKSYRNTLNQHKKRTRPHFPPTRTRYNHFAGKTVSLTDKKDSYPCAVETNPPTLGRQRPICKMRRRAPPRRRAERAGVLCGEHSSTLRQVLEYSPQSTIRDSARRPSAFTVPARRFPLPRPRDCHTPPPDIRRSEAARKIPPSRLAGRRRHVAPRKSASRLDYKSLHSSWIFTRAPERRSPHKNSLPRRAAMDGSLPGEIVLPRREGYWFTAWPFSTAAPLVGNVSLNLPFLPTLASSMVGVFPSLPS